MRNEGTEGLGRSRLRVEGKIDKLSKKQGPLATLRGSTVRKSSLGGGQRGSGTKACTGTTEKYHFFEEEEETCGGRRT